MNDNRERIAKVISSVPIRPIDLQGFGQSVRKLNNLSALVIANRIINELTKPSIKTQMAELVLAHSSVLPDVEDGDPITQETEWTCNECSELIGTGINIEAYTADHQADVLADWLADKL